ncbi:hypothetical protein FACS1894122_01850 [Alphaproteobacteria bacterium]|nr:hypothetical protein FACS1894122_01850 [Alphaproteobacteria bacterium]
MGIVYNIPMTECFLARVADFLLNNIKNFQHTNIVLPNGRSCRILKNYLVQNAHAKTFMLPKISSISDELRFDTQKITALVMNQCDVGSNISTDTKFELAKSICSLIKELVFANVDLNRLPNMVPEHLLEYWNPTLEILQKVVAPLAFTHIDFASTLQAHLAYLATSSKASTLAVGIENKNYYTGLFLKKVAESENGIIFITGSEDENSRNYQLNKELLTYLQRDVGSVCSIDSASALQAHHAYLSAGSEAENGSNVTLAAYLSAGSETENGSNVTLAAYLSAGSETENGSNVTLAEFASPAEEAFGVAIAVRKAIHEKKSVLIVSTDSKLSEKIKMELGRWNIVPNDSSGVQFSKTRSGMLVSLIADMIEKNFNLLNVLEVLKASRKYNDFLFPFELFCRKQSIVPTNFFDAISIYNKTEIELEVLDELKRLSSIKPECKQTFGKWFEYCNKCAKLLDEKASGEFEHISRQFTKNSHLLGEMSVSEFVIFLKNQVFTIGIKSPQASTDGIVMCNIQNAQLEDADMIIITGANEDNLKTSEKNNFWMSKSMASALGIQTTSAKDAFVQCIFERLVHKPNVLITRSQIVDGVEQQKYSYIDKIADKLSITKAEDLVNLVEHLRYSIKKESIKFTAPIPDVKNRPNRFSVTDITLLKNNAYVFYAKKVLNLKELNYLDDPKNLKGNYVHKVLDTLIKFAKNKTDINEAKVIAKSVLKNMWLDESHFGLWFFRLKNILSFVCNNVSQNDELISEVSGECTINVSPDYAFTVLCKADRIDVHPDQTISIIDYKTSSLPTAKQIEYGYKPQLSIEAIIAKNNGFSIEKTNVKDLYFLRLDGSEKTGETRAASDSIEKTETLIKNTIAGLAELISYYNVLGIPYDININSAYDQAYAHLARVKEWSDNWTQE